MDESGKTGKRIIDIDEREYDPVELRNSNVVFIASKKNLIGLAAKEQAMAITSGLASNTLSIPNSAVSVVTPPPMTHAIIASAPSATTTSAPSTSVSSLAAITPSTTAPSAMTASATSTPVSSLAAITPSITAPSATTASATSTPVSSLAAISHFTTLPSSGKPTPSATGKLNLAALISHRNQIAFEIRTMQAFLAENPQAKIKDQSMLTQLEDKYKNVTIDINKRRKNLQTMTLPSSGKPTPAHTAASAPSATTAPSTLDPSSRTPTSAYKTVSAPSASPHSTPQPPLSSLPQSSPQPQPYMASTLPSPKSSTNAVSIVADIDANCLLFRFPPPRFMCQPWTTPLL